MVTKYKAEEADEFAQHDEVRGCASTVNAAKKGSKKGQPMNPESILLP